MRRLWVIGSTLIGLGSTVATLLALTRPAHAAANLPLASGSPPGQNRPGSGALLPSLNFAIVGDTRPARVDDLAGYPTAVITKIWQDIAATNTPFAVTTGNYMFASPAGTTAAPQLALYLQAQANFKGPVFHAMGNDECTGLASSNCGPGNPDGLTSNYKAFMSNMLPPGHKLPYYVVNFHGPSNKWTAKFVILAGNAWSAAQAAWLDRALSVPTTYTFIVRNPPIGEATAPCLAAKGAGNADTIISKHPYTLLIVGHTHTYAYNASQKEVVVGNGGAPLSGSVNYGYVLATQLTNGKMKFSECDYITTMPTSSFTVSP